MNLPRPMKIGHVTLYMLTCIVVSLFVLFILRVWIYSNLIRQDKVFIG